jgi:uncharacterized membrane protein HdeD (DUF308 family)
MHHIMAKFWWILALRGILGILLGIASLVWIWDLSRPAVDVFGLSLFIRPAAIAGTLIVMLGLYAFMDGIFSILLGSQDYGDGRRWGALIVEGILSIGLGLVAWLKPEVAAPSLLYWITAWAVATGLMEIIQASDLNEYKERKRPLLFAGICSMAYGVSVLYLRMGGSSLVWATGLYAFLFAMPLLALAFRLRSFVRSSPR